MTGSFSGVEIVKNGKDVDLQIYQGANIDFTILFKTGSSTGAAIDLTGKKARAQFRKSLRGTVVTSFESTASSITIDSTAGSLRFTKSSTATAALETITEGVWDCELVTISTGFVAKVLSGGFRVIPEVTI